jgi:hypothetical protein
MKRFVVPVLTLALLLLGAVLWRFERSPAGPRGQAGDRASGSEVTGASADALAGTAKAKRDGADASVAKPAEQPLDAMDCDAPQGNVVTVDGEGITALEFCAAWRRMSGPSTGGDSAVMDKQGKALLQQMIDARLVARALAAAGHPVQGADVDTSLTEMWTKRGASRASVEESLRTQGIDLSVVRADLRQRLELAKLVELRADVEPSEQAIAALYAADPTRWGTPRSATVEVFLARAAPTAPAAERAKAHAVADAFAAGVARGGAPKALAEASGMKITPPFELTADAGEPELAAAAFSLQPQQWSPVVPARVGWAVARLVKITEGKARPLADVRERIRALLLNDHKLSEQQRLLQELRAAAKIVQLQW